jgi:selenocysteine-specific elongation factor
LIVATAGHIDHGKTRLVHALTGVDTDRLAEEKRRGMSIDLGFAYRTLDDGRVIGFVDVPGHERFLSNMLAGVAAIDFALLVVAADDGPMPQTVEHLAILDLLGVKRGAVVLTKIDRAEPEQRRKAETATAAVLEGTALAGAPVYALSSTTGEGVPALQAVLAAAALETPPVVAEGAFRLAVDRCFTLAGIGLIVTGAAFSGRVAPGESLMLSPAGLTARVRAIHANNRAAESGQAGERLALDLTGLKKENVRRGDWLLAPALHAPTDRIDTRLILLRGEPRPLRQGRRVQCHLGAAAVPGRVALIDARSLAPGASARAQLVLDRPLGALYGDRFIIRDPSVRRTLGGGRVIDAFGPRRGRARPERLAQLDGLEEADPARALGALLAAAPAGADLTRFALGRNLPPDKVAAALEACGALAVGGPQGVRAFAPGSWRALKEAFLAALGEAHRARPERAGETPRALARGGLARMGAAALERLVNELAAEGRVQRAGALVHLPGHAVRMSEPERRLWRRIEPLILADPLSPPAAPEVAKRTGAPARAVERLLVSAARRGLIMRVAPNRFLSPAAVRQLAETAETLARDEPEGFSAARFRDHARIGRNLAIDLLEFFDRSGFTQRRGERRRIVKPAQQVFGP